MLCCAESEGHEVACHAVLRLAARLLASSDGRMCCVWLHDCLQALTAECGHTWVPAYQFCTDESHDHEEYWRLCLSTGYLLALGTPDTTIPRRVWALVFMMTWSSLCNIAMLNFVQNDLFWAVRQFLDNAHGSFGLAVMSEVDTGSLVLAAYKQPMTLTFAPHTG